jgi:pimeloyl-ACP methyl ester carboxylesterase
MQRVTREGVTLAYEEAGSGAPPLLLVHGWTHDHTYLQPQFDHFARHHRTVAVDLRGHGDSDKPDQIYSIQSLADDLAWLVYELGLHRPVVVAHSMGGLIGLDLAGRYPDRVSAAILLDPPIFVPQQVRDALTPITAALRSPDFRQAQRTFVESTSFLPTDDVDRKARIIEDMSSAPQHVMAGCWEAMFAYDPTSAAAACVVPLLYVASANPVADLTQFRAACPGLVTGQTVGAGHYHQLEVPDQVNAMIERFIAIAVTSTVGTYAHAG